MTYNFLGRIGSIISLCTGDKFLNLMQLRLVKIVNIHSNHYWGISYVIGIVSNCKVIGGKAGTAIMFYK